MIEFNPNKVMFNYFFKPILEGSGFKKWLKTAYYYMTSSKYRKYVELSAFCKDQIKNPAPELVELAKKFKVIKASDSDKQIVNILKWTRDNLVYRSDKGEMWDDAIQVLFNKRDDCDGYMIFIYTIAVLAGIDERQLWGAIGDVNINNNTSGHAWNLYLSLTDDKMYSVDGTFYPDYDNLECRSKFYLSPKGRDHYKSIWCVFNSRGAYKPK